MRKDECVIIVIEMVDKMQSIGQIKNCWKISQFQLPIRRFFSQWNCSSLPDRSVLKVTGVEASTFLQGLMTNDIDVLVENERKR